MNISWLNLEDLVEYELRQQQEEGKDVARFRQRWENLQQVTKKDRELRNQAIALMHELAALPPTNEVVKQEPSTLAEIRALCPAPTCELPKPLRSNEALGDHIAGGWLGRAAGCLLGKPVEKHSRAAIKEILLSNGSWPLSHYITEEGIPIELLQKYPWNKHSGRESLRENMVCMTEDDDMNYPMLNLHVLETHGSQFSTGQLAANWLSLLPVLSTFTAERVAYLNCLAGLDPPETATANNPYREWIGAQIRADLWGWVSPGNPQQAAGLAWRDARLSHVRNGIYGEMFFAAVIAAAFVCDTIQQMLEHGLSQIPQKSRLAAAIRFAQSLPAREKNWEAAVDRLYEQFGSYHWVHTINNAALVAAALLYGDGDYERSICCVVMGGWDTDSNGATVGSILGTWLGAKKLPSKWIAPLNNKIRSSMKGFDYSTFDDLAQRALKQVI
ncbi:MAG: ADP-ribosylglycohydrolase family protein [bacterium]